MKKILLIFPIPKTTNRSLRALLSTIGNRKGVKVIYAMILSEDYLKLDQILFNSEDSFRCHSSFNLVKNLKKAERTLPRIPVSWKENKQCLKKGTFIFILKKIITILSVRANVYFFEMSLRYNKAYYHIN